MADKTLEFGAPIPGANYTSDTKNYPWHRPPEITNLDEAIEASFKRLIDEDAANGLMTMIEMGMPISALTEAFVMSGIGAGKWSPDFAILLAGPVSHIIYMMAKGYGLDPDMGLEPTERPPTSAFFKAVGRDKKTIEESIENVDLDQIMENAGPGPTREGSGFMSMAEVPGDEGGAVDDPMGSVEAPMGMQEEGLF